MAGPETGRLFFRDAAHTDHDRTLRLIRRGDSLRVTILIALSAAADGMVQMIFRDFAAQRVAVDAQDFGGAALVSSGMLQDTPNEFLLEFREGFFEQNAALDHHSYQRFQLLFHVCMLRSEAPGKSPRA
jgi:hypothetical protein